MIGNREIIKSDGSHLPRELVTQIEWYVEQVLIHLELNYWKVWVACDRPPADCKMMIEPTDGRRVAMLYVQDDWVSQDAVSKRLDITHECLHLMHHDQEEVIRRFKNNQGDTSHYAMGIVWEQFEIETERMVDSLSYLMAPWMPEWEF